MRYEKNLKMAPSPMTRFFPRYRVKIHFYPKTVISRTVHPVAGSSLRISLKVKYDNCRLNYELRRAWCALSVSQRLASMLHASIFILLIPQTFRGCFSSGFHLNYTKPHRGLMATHGRLTVCKVLNSSHALEEL